MKKTISILLVSILLTNVYPLYSQVSLEGILPVKIVSPQVADFMRYNNSASVTKSSGRLDFTVNLASLSEQKFNIPISLSYNSSGFMPNKNSGIVGLNWILNAGGVITREINGIADDCENEKVPINGIKRTGMLALVKAPQNYSDEDILQLNNISTSASSIYFSSSNNHYINIEATSDIYHFNFLGYSGKFTIGADGNVKVISYNSGDFQVDLTDYNFDNERASYWHIDYGDGEFYVKNSTIKIIADDGYIYHFGGTNETLEYTYQCYDYGEPNRDGGYPITSFHLSKIITPDGDILNIEYEPYNPISIDFYNYFVDKSQHYVYSERRLEGKWYWVNGTEPCGFLGVHCPSNRKESRSFNQDRPYLTKIARIKRISGKNQTINFYYSKDANPLYKNRNDYSNCGSKLDSIVQKSNDNNFKKKINFVYRSVQNRLFLTELQIQDQKYSFDYYNLNDLPAVNNVIVDHWGFWNDQSTGSLIPNFTHDMYEFTYTDEKREAGSNVVVKKGMLREVTYPTGGKLTIDYERHSYEKRIETITNKKPSKPVLINKSGVAGGTRVKTLTFSDSTKNTVSSFNYTKGTLYNYPVYIKYLNRYQDNIVDYNSDVYTYVNSNTNYYSYQYDHVLYSEVKETMGDGAYTISVFTDYDTNPDIVSSPTNSPNYENNNLSNISNVYFKADDYAFQRGKLLREDNYNAAGTLIQRISNTYQNSYNGKVGVGISELSAFSNPVTKTLIASYKIPLYSYNLVEQTITTNGVEEKTKYSYNWQNLLVETIQYTSGDGWGGNPIITDYRYPSHYEPTSPYDEMCAANIINPVVFKQVIHRNGWQSERYNYGKFFGFIRNTPVYMPKNLQYQNSAGLDLIKEQYDYNIYDRNFGNYPVIKNLAYKYSDFDKTVYLWSYNGEYPVAEIKNATYDQVTNALDGLFLIYQIAIADEPSSAHLSAINNLRNTLPNAFVTTYTYKPFVGMTSTTDPRGITTYYEYDRFGRLQTIKIGEKDSGGNEKKRVLQTYDYHYYNSGQ